MPISFRYLTPTVKLPHLAIVTLRTVMMPEPDFRRRPPTKYGVPELFGRSLVRSRLIALGAAAAVLALTGCTDKTADAAGLPPVQIVEQPAASAGGACILWDYAFIQKQIGIRFTVAAADQVEDTSTCVVQTEDGDWPNLTLAVVESTTADGALFLDSLMPPKATKLKGLGKAGYRLITAAGNGHGPTIEIGWLSEAAQLQTLKFTFATDARTATVNQMPARLLTLAKAMDTSA
jgi:hypothetical protein